MPPEDDGRPPSAASVPQTLEGARAGARPAPAAAGPPPHITRCMCALLIVLILNLTCLFVLNYCPVRIKYNYSLIGRY